MDLMIDLETMGLAPGSAVISIGAVLFNPYEESDLRTAPSFYQNISLTSCILSGLTVNLDTVAFWKDQGSEAKNALEEDIVSLPVAVDNFYQWAVVLGFERVWAHSPHFDCINWQCACEAVDMKYPWSYKQLMDTRTLFYATGFDWRAFSDGIDNAALVHHNALDDSILQARGVQAAFAKLFRERQNPVPPSMPSATRHLYDGSHMPASRIGIDWTPWSGTEAVTPVPAIALVEVLMSNGDTERGLASKFDWMHHRDRPYITAWRNATLD